MSPSAAQREARGGPGLGCASGVSEERVTFCRICEPLCGMVATVEDDRIVKLHPDPDHPLSRGYACPKGIAMQEVQNDPDRVTHPLRRMPSKSGAVEVPVKVTDEMTPGTVALPHGWGHRGGWRLANEHAGANVNLLSSSDPDDLEPLAGMAHLNGIPVRVAPATASAAAAAP